MTRRPAVLQIFILLLVGASAMAAQSKKFEAERSRLHGEAMAAQKAMGITDSESDPRLKKYPAAALKPVAVQKVLPGGALSVALAGTIPAGVAVLSDRDGAVLAGAATTGTSYSARLSVGPAEGPGFIKLWALTPVSFALTEVPVAFIDSVYRFDLTSANGIAVKAIPAAKSFTIEGTKATLRYQVEFYKSGDAKPFETRVATMAYNVSDDPRARLDLPLIEPESPAEAEFNEVSRRLADPTISAAERQALAQRQANAQQRMLEDMMNAAKDPAAAARKRDNFGCYMLQVYPGDAGAARGMTVCGPNFNGGRIETTGTMTLVK